MICLFYMYVCYNNEEKAFVSGSMRIRRRGHGRDWREEKEERK